MQDDIPPNEYYEYFGPDYKLHIPPEEDIDNKNKRDALEKVRRCCQGVCCGHWCCFCARLNRANALRSACATGKVATPLHPILLSL